MSVNRYQPHVLVVPEDDANLQLANGFLLEPLRPRTIQVLEEVGGWNQLIERFISDHVVYMQRFPTSSIVLLLDFDGDPGRLDLVKSKIPANLSDRVYVLGALKEPEDLRRAGLGSYETIGLALAKDCREETDTTWRHDLLRHNASELDRLRERVRPILFAS